MKNRLSTRETGRGRATALRNCKSLADTRVSPTEGEGETLETICKRATGQGTINHQENRCWRSSAWGRPARCRWHPGSRTEYARICPKNEHPLSSVVGLTLQPRVPYQAPPFLRTSMNCVDMQIPGQQWDPFVEKWVVLARTGLPTPSCLVTERHFPSHFVNWNERNVKICLFPLFLESIFSVNVQVTQT